jgi:hypothetical protein
MSLSEGLIARLVARITAISLKDWRGKAGDRFRSTTQAMSDFAEEHRVSPRNVLDEGIELGRRKLHGLADQELAEGAKNFADAENIKIDSKLRLRSLESDVRKRDADARKANAEARIAELKVVSAELALLKQLHDADVVLRKDSSGNLTILPSEEGVNLLQLAEQRRLEAGAPEVSRDRDGIHLVNSCVGPIAFPDESVIIEGGALVYGDIYGLTVELRANATVTGNVFARDMATLRDKARLEGNIQTQKASIEEGSYFKGELDIRKA